VIEFPLWAVGLLVILFFGGIAFAWRLGRSRGKRNWPTARPQPREPKNKEELARRDFVANVSHELRTPVSIIKGFSDSMIEDYPDLKEKQKKHFLEKIQRNAQRLHALVEDLLALATLERAEPSLKLEKLDFYALIRSTVENGIGYQNRASTPIALDIPEEELMIHADTQKLVSLIENLVENASLHAEGVTQIKVRARKESSAPYVLCSIEDNGQGIPEEELSRLFERFYRVDKGRSRERGGTGLGLSIAREVVEAHGGEISASSLQGKGTSFSFRIPTLT
jgi:two-component system, OmpR family, phosphate regulon sensor histidine kinase PhoR